MKSALPKALHRVAQTPMVSLVVRAAESLQPDRITVVVGPDMDDVSMMVAPHQTVIQPAQKGTGDAVRCALPLLEGFDGDVLVLFGDTPLITAETLRRMVDRLRASDAPSVVVLGMCPDDPGAYGRLVVDDGGALTAIVEHADADAEQRRIALCNGGIMAFDGRRLGTLIDGLEDGNAQGELYLTDTIAAARRQGLGCVVVEGDAEEAQGINTRADLAAVERVMQGRLRRRAMAEGATLVDPEAVYLAADTELGRDVVIHPGVVFGPGVTVEDGVEILGFCHFEHAVIRRGARVGPFARLRPGADIGEQCHVGNFVEFKNARLGAGAKANHFAYLGDATIGERSNIGAGTIVCNYDGFFKHRTVIGDEVFVGSNASLVAPLTVGDRATIGAGSVITKPVAPDALAVERAAQMERRGWSTKFRALRQAEKDRLAKKQKG